MPHCYAAGPHRGGNDISGVVNEVRIKFSDEHLSMFPMDRSAVWVYTEGLVGYCSCDGGQELLRKVGLSREYRWARVWRSSRWRIR